jgi:hypothetical protein
MHDKDYMLEEIACRIECLKEAYRKAVTGFTIRGDPVTKSGGACLRSRIKKDICALTLVKEILEQCTDDIEISDPDSITGFNRLVKG